MKQGIYKVLSNERLTETVYKMVIDFMMKILLNESDVVQCVSCPSLLADLNRTNNE